MKGQIVKILALGGDPDTGRELLSILGREGYQVDLAASLVAGMAQVDSRQYGLLILDLNMFRGNELILLRQIREKDRNLPVVALGDLPPDDAVVGSMHELNRYFQKPLSKDELVEAVRAIALDRDKKPGVRTNLLAVVGGRIRAERKRQNLTLKQVAEKTRLSVSLLSQIERAESAASVSSLFKIAAALQVSLQGFFEGF
jgi:DNA-binding response OmpR family regulator